MNGQIALSQRQYIEEILHNFPATKAKQTPLSVGVERMLENVNTQVETQPPILDFVGMIRFLADRLKPDLAYAASFMARFASSPTEEQKKLIPRICQYLLHAKDKKIIIGSKKKEIKLFAFADASFVRAGDSKAQLGYCFYLGTDCGAIHHKSQKDKTVSISSTHAEVNALVETVKMTTWIRALLQDIGFAQDEPTIIYQDNINVIYVTETIGHDQRTRYLINKINYIRETIKQGTIQLRYIPTQ